MSYIITTAGGAASLCYLSGATLYLKNYDPLSTGGSDSIKHYEILFSLGVVSTILYVIFSIIAVFLPFTDKRLSKLNNGLSENTNIMIGLEFIYSIINLGFLIYLIYFTVETIFPAYNTSTDKTNIMNRIQTKMLYFIFLFIIFNLIFIAIMFAYTIYHLYNRFNYDKQTPIIIQPLNDEPLNDEPLVFEDEKITYTKVNQITRTKINDDTVIDFNL